jgi:preprotein translocase subunit SecE
MAAHAESSSSAFDTAKLVAAILMLVIGIGAFYYFAEKFDLLYRVLGVVGLGGVAVYIVFTTAIGRQLLGFLKEARIEVRKVVWPTRQETTQATLVVVALVFLVGLILWLLDMFLFWGISLLTGQGA